MVTAANGFSGWVVIRRPILRVYEYVEDPMRWHEWVPLYNPVSVATGLASRRFEIDVGMPPFTQREAVEVVDRVPGRSITFQSHRVMPQTATYTFEPTAGGTLVTGLHVPRYWGAVSPWIGFVGRGERTT
jgi:uncharacterized protein YndB with AHSA1/START domain